MDHFQSGRALGRGKRGLKGMGNTLPADGINLILFLLFGARRTDRSSCCSRGYEMLPDGVARKPARVTQSNTSSKQRQMMGVAPSPSRRLRLLCLYLCFPFLQSSGGSSPRGQKVTAARSRSFVRSFVLSLPLRAKGKIQSRTSVRSFQPWHGARLRRGFLQGRWALDAFVLVL